MKICGRCNEVLDDSEFYTLKNGKLHTYCKKCVNKINNDRYKRFHKESVEETIRSEQEKADLRELWLKRCGRCGGIFPLDMFCKNKKRRDGLDPICKRCKSKNNSLKYTSREQYNELLEKGLKKCPLCSKILPMSEFTTTGGNLRSRCSSCERKTRAEYRNKIRGTEKEKERKEAKKKYDLEHRDEARERYRKNYEKNKDKIDKNHKEYTKRRYNTDPIYRLKCSVRNCIGQSFKRTGHVKKENTEKIVGISVEMLIDYLKNTFLVRYGYEWDGIEAVHIDHIVPLCTATTEEEVIKLCHYTNLQLLKAHDNLVKNNKSDWEGNNANH